LNEDILTTIKIGNVNLYTASRSETYFLEKKLFNTKQLYKSGLVDYLKVELSNPVIIIFGSYAKGEDTENSDIDLYVETLSKKQVNLEKFKKLLQRDIQLFRFENIKEMTNLYLANNVINGITLNNYIQVF